MMKQMITLGFCSVVAVACTAEPVEPYDVQEPTLEDLLSQCGSTWDVQDVESYDGTAGVSTGFVDTHEPAVGYHVGPGCSGTMITADLFLSAGHCGYAVGDAVRFNYQDDPNGVPRTTTDYNVIEIVEQEDTSTWDYAIVRLDGNAGTDFGMATLHHSDYPDNATVALIQHPARVPKVVHAGPVVDYNSSLGANWFRHEVDTTGGSSGSGVLGDNGRLVGVHTNAGCSTGTIVGGNSAMRMSQLLDHSPTLAGIFPGWSYCSATDPCPDGFGDCDSDSECESGTTCVNDVGASYGWNSAVDVCEASTTVEVRMKGRIGDERIRLQIDGSTVQTWSNIGTSWTVESFDVDGTIDWSQVRIRFDNDNGTRDAYIDWVELDDERRQAEDQATNTAKWAGTCGGGGFSQDMHCNGYIQF